MKFIPTEAKLKFRELYIYLANLVKALSPNTKIGLLGFMSLFIMVLAKYAPHTIFGTVSVLTFLVSGCLVFEVLNSRLLLLGIILQFILSMTLYLFDISRKLSDLMIILIFLEIAAFLLFKLFKSEL